MRRRLKRSCSTPAGLASPSTTRRPSRLKNGAVTIVRFSMSVSPPRTVTHPLPLALLPSSVYVPDSRARSNAPFSSTLGSLTLRIGSPFSTRMLEEQTILAEVVRLHGFDRGHHAASFRVRRLQRLDLDVSSGLAAAVEHAAIDRARWRHRQADLGNGLPRCDRYGHWRPDVTGSRRG